MRLLLPCVCEHTSVKLDGDRTCYSTAALLQGFCYSIRLFCSCIACSNCIQTCELLRNFQQGRSYLSTCDMQGEFNAREPVTAVFEWVSDCLRDPSLTYELILPTRRPLVTSMARVSEADLLPSALLNLRFDTPQQMPSLRNTLLQQVE